MVAKAIIFMLSQKIKIVLSINWNRIYFQKAQYLPTAELSSDLYKAEKRQWTHSKVVLDEIPDRYPVSIYAYFPSLPFPSELNEKNLKKSGTECLHRLLNEKRVTVDRKLTSQITFKEKIPLSNTNNIFREKTPLLCVIGNIVQTDWKIKQLSEIKTRAYIYIYIFLRCTFYRQCHQIYSVWKF